MYDARILLPSTADTDLLTTSHTRAARGNGSWSAIRGTPRWQRWAKLSVARTRLRCVLDWWSPPTWPASGWSAVAAWIALVIGVVAARLVWGQVAEARRLRVEQAAPYVMIDFEPDPGTPFVMLLVIANVGATPALDIQFEFEPPLATSLDDTERPLRDTALLTQGIPTLPPGKRVQTHFDFMINRNSRQKNTRLPDTFNATVSFRDSSGTMHQYAYLLDLGFYWELEVSGSKNIHHVTVGIESLVKELRQINRHLELLCRPELVLSDQRQRLVS